MININQKRIAYAFDCKDCVKKEDDEGDALSGFPSLIINCGLANTLLYAKEKGGQNTKIAKKIISYLQTIDYVKTRINNKDEDIKADVSKDTELKDEEAKKQKFAELKIEYFVCELTKLQDIL